MRFFAILEERNLGFFFKPLLPMQ